MRIAWLAAAAAVAASPACDCGGGRGVPPDARPADVDAAGADAGHGSDAAPGDAATTDAAAPDAGSRPDAAPGDAGATDAASAPDAAPPAVVLINEVVVYPLRDWNDSDGFGMPYDGEPGHGIITSVDEFVELYNAGTAPVDLRAWTLEMIDESPETTVLGAHPSIVATPGSTVAALQPGHYLVVGNPRGFSSTDVFVVLRDDAGRVVDDVEIGGNNGAADPEGDGSGDGAPDGIGNGLGRGVFEEAIARPAGAPDTDDDIADFVRMPATPLAPNVPPEPPVESDPPVVVANAEGTAFPVSDNVWVTFNEPVAGASATPAVIHVSVGGVDLPVDAVTLRDDDATLVAHTVGRLPYDADVDVVVRGGVEGVTDRAGNPLAADVSFQVHTEPRPADPAGVVINEIVSSPLQDWDDSEGGDGVAFSPVPGTGAVDSRDEWVELVSRLPANADLSGYSIVVYRGFNPFGAARTVTPIGGPASTYVTRLYGAGTGLTDVAPGDRIVVGNPIGSLPFDFVIELRDESGALVDAVEVGGNTPAQDRGGDGVDNGAPAPGADGRALNPGEEAIARIPDGVDTGDDAADFAYAVPTLGAPN
ncbi:MAG: hypothetical protein D6689_03695 [Deltaproteobacteria bacterium]|nr:MAG: hypothetical protein D6689_03695 [Deltaproteobacteria bacterium]